MRRTTRRLTAIAMAAAMLTGLAGCAGKTADDPKPQSEVTETEKTESAAETKAPESTGVKTENTDTLVVAVSTEPSKLDPQNNALLAGMLVERQIYETLVIKNEQTGGIEPKLATDWSWADDVTLQMTLRDDVYFQNGDRMTAEDVLYTIQRFAKGSATGSLYSAFDGENSKALDDTHIEIKFKTTCAPALLLLANVRASIVSKDYVEEAGEDALARNPMGTGPFSYVDWVAGDRINLVRSDSYWGSKPSYENLVIRIITNETARMIELETGGVDIMTEPASTDIVRLRDGVEGCVMYQLDGYKNYWIGFNESDPYLSDVKVRQAIAYTLDTAAIAENAFGEQVVPAKSCLGTNLLGFKEMPKYPSDPEKAKSLLAEAGYPDGFSIDMVVSEAVRNQRTAEIVQAMLSQIGIAVNISVYDGATESSMRQDGQESIFVGNLTCNTGDADQYFSRMAADSSSKSDRKTDERFNEMLEQARTELDVEKREAIYAEIQQYVYDQVLVIPLAQMVTIYGVRDYVKDFVPDPGIIPDFSTVTIAK